MPDPLDLLTDIGTNNELFENIRELRPDELQERPWLIGQNPVYLLEPQLDPLQILVQCEEMDAEEGCESGHHLKIYYETFETTIRTTRKPSK